MEKLTDELLNRKVSDRINESTAVLVFWWREYNKHWPQNSLKHKSLASKAFGIANSARQKAY